MVKQADDTNFAQQIAQGVSLVDFYADWCGPCRMIAPIVEQLSKDLAGRANILKVNVDVAQNSAAQYNVVSIPTLIVFKDGLEVDRVVGLRDADFLKQLVVSQIK